MFGSETGDGCTVKMPSAPKGGGVGRGGQGSSGGPMMPAATVSSVLHNAAPVWAFTVANLQQLPQDQVHSRRRVLDSCLITFLFLPCRSTLLPLRHHQACNEW